MEDLVGTEEVDQVLEEQEDLVIVIRVFVRRLSTQWCRVTSSTTGTALSTSTSWD